MASPKEIRSKIGSIKNTQKITSAMEMVAASKMRKAQERQALTLPYASKIRQVIGHLARAHAEYRHLFLDVRPIKRAGLIVVTTDRGLCGPLNANLLRVAITKMAEYKAQNIEHDLCVIGSKGVNFFRRLGGHIIAHTEHLTEAPKASALIGIIKVMLERYENGEIDQILLVHNRFINTMVQKPQVVQLLPLVPDEDETLKYHWDYIYEPDAKELLTALLQRYIEMQVYQSVVENMACEQASRMIAMKNATDNAGELIGDLQLMYNKARQAAITKEIAEIVGGADAV